MSTSVKPTLSLAARYYTDPAVFQAEKYGVLATTWQFAGHVSQLVHPGDYFCFSIADENLFCVKTRSGEIKGFYNVCQHRAHQLLSGTGNSSQIICPYHAWTYELTGKLRSGPNTRSVPGFDKDAICLTEIAIENFCGFLFANLDPLTKPMRDWFPGVSEELSSFVPDIHHLQPLKWIEIPEHCNWKVSVENYSECYHCQLNHRTFANGIVKPGTYDIQPQGYCLRHTTECQNLDKMSYQIDVTANEFAGQYSSWFLWPMMSFQVYPGNILNTYHWRPVDHENVIVYRGWYAAPDSDESLLYDLAKQDRETTVEEDIHLVESVQRGLNSRGYKPGPLVLDPQYGIKSEHSIEVLQRWIRESVDG
ncbi:MAG: aromatic ring-hydroxylating dioxygenase subunit alpha [Granulosicoccus sp.]|nr:aromatic ring-hydroxylating dioxygenase subunit alpha [Granulosicoccus sp.]